MTADEGRPSTVRKANRSGCIPTGGFVRTEGARGGELLIAGLNVFVSN